jgi:hypothetical protein
LHLERDLHLLSDEAGFIHCLAVEGLHQTEHIRAPERWKIICFYRLLPRCCMIGLCKVLGNKATNRCGICGSPPVDHGYRLPMGSASPQARIAWHSVVWCGQVLENPRCASLCHTAPSSDSGRATWCWLESTALLWARISCPEKIGRGRGHQVKRC